MIWLGDAVQAYGDAIQVCIVGQHIQGCGGILTEDRRIIGCHRRIIFRINRQTHRCRIGAAGAIRNRVSKAVGAVVVGVGGIGNRAIFVDSDQAMLRLGNAIQAYGIAIQIAIVGEHVQGRC